MTSPRNSVLFSIATYILYESRRKASLLGEKKHTPDKGNRTTRGKNIPKQIYRKHEEDLYTVVFIVVKRSHSQRRGISQYVRLRRMKIQIRSIFIEINRLECRVDDISKLFFLFFLNRKFLWNLYLSSRFILQKIVSLK